MDRDTQHKPKKRRKTTTIGSWCARKKKTEEYDFLSSYLEFLFDFIFLLLDPNGCYTSHQYNISTVATQNRITQVLAAYVTIIGL